ncbi:nuclease-related domain-containing protein [Streptomyces sp. NPDC037389]|uniref:nuclease-related domain-containing protein n=1 Tax=Streptomyces sp. NPDC037389 TaxID=3155369 RepID=UPI0033EFD574
MRPNPTTHRPLQRHDHRHRPQDAGASAARRARQLRRDELRQNSVQHAVLLAGTALAAYMVSIPARLLPPLPSALTIAGAVLPVLWAIWHVHRPSDAVRRWRRGAAGERRTARLLHPLTRGKQGWIILHDRAIPRSRANLDHLLVRPDGAVFYCDSKALRPGARIHVRDGILHCGHRPYPSAINTVIWEAAQAADALGVPVTPLIAVHDAEVPGHVLHDSKVVIVAATRLTRELRRSRYIPNRAAAEQIAARAEALLPRHTAR